MASAGAPAHAHRALKGKFVRYWPGEYPPPHRRLFTRGRQVAVAWEEWGRQSGVCTSHTFSFGALNFVKRKLVSEASVTRGPSPQGLVACSRRLAVLCSA